MRLSGHPVAQIGHTAGPSALGAGDQPQDGEGAQGAALQPGREDTSKPPTVRRPSRSARHAPTSRSSGSRILHHHASRSACPRPWRGSRRNSSSPCRRRCGAGLLVALEQLELLGGGAGRHLERRRPAHWRGRCGFRRACRAGSWRPGYGSARRPGRMGRPARRRCCGCAGTPRATAGHGSWSASGPVISVTTFRSVRPGHIRAGQRRRGVEELRSARRLVRHGSWASTPDRLRSGNGLPACSTSTSRRSTARSVNAADRAPPPARSACRAARAGAVVNSATSSSRPDVAKRQVEDQHRGHHRLGEVRPASSVVVAAAPRRPNNACPGVADMPNWPGTA